jgi:hypothetical protein
VWGGNCPYDLNAILVIEVPTNIERLLMNLVEQLMTLAMEIESEDPIDWGMLTVKEEDVYKLVANNVLESYLLSDPEDREMIMLATAVKLIVENYVLHMKLMQRRNE